MKDNKLPDGWRIDILNNVTSIIRNGANIKQGEEEGGYPITRIETISNSFIDINKLGYAGIEELGKYKDYLLQQGDILMSHINSEKHLGKVAIYENCNIEIIHGMNLLCFRFSDEIILSKYAYYFFNTKKFKIQLPRITKKSVNQASFSIRDLKNLKIIIPPLEIQKKIIEVLEKAEKVIEKRKEAIRLLDELVKSKFIEMFGDPVLNPKNWEVKTVIDVCDCMVPGRDKPKSFTGSTPWITIDDLVVNGVTGKSKSSLGLTDDEINEVKRKKVPKGSVLMSCVGNLGICSIAGEEMIINQQLHSFQCKDINNFFLMYYLGFRKDYMMSQASSTTVLYMNKTVCNSIPLYLPPIELQNQFADFVNQIDKLKF
ncbi:restriction endonuclease subunit S, partial [Clostridium tetani]